MGGDEVDASSMTSLVQSGLTLIVKQSSRKHKQLRTAATKVTDYMKKLSPEQLANDRDADKFFFAFKLACETESAKLMELSLDCVQKLIAYGYLRGSGIADDQKYPRRKVSEQAAEDKDTASPEKSKNRERRRLIDVVIETVYECSMYENDKVQLQVIKALLTAVTSVTCKVHAHSLLIAVRACYHIYLTSRNMVNQTTAKATLTQMLNIVFQRMEHFAAQLAEMDKEALANADSTDADSSQHNGSIQNGSADDTEHKNSDADADADAATASASATTADAADAGKGSVGDGGDAASQSPSAEPEAGSTIESKLAFFDDVINADPRQQAHSPRTVVAAQFAMLQHDAFLLFRALCKLSMKVLPSPPEPIALASKTLSLELLLSVLDHPGPVFRNAEVFLELVRENLVMSLLQNSVVPQPTVFRLSSSLFVLLIAHFKPHLKVEIGVFLEKVYINILDSSNATYGHKKMALEVFNRICQDPQTLVELFLNYDCDDQSKSSNIFQGLVEQLNKISKGGFSSKDWMTPEQEANLRRIAIEGFTHVMKSLVAWSESAGRAPGLSLTASTSVASTIAPPHDDEDEEDGKSTEMDPEQPVTPNAEKRTRASVARADTEDDELVADAASSAASPATGAAARPAFKEQFAKQRDRQKKIDAGVLKFNFKPKKGLIYLKEHGIVDDSAESLALFFKNTKGLDKTVVGDYLGDMGDFPKAVRNAFIDSIDFHEMTFDDALRHFLSDFNFRLPGEAQKIDRLMEKFADQFCNHNPGQFSSADTAYVLAYAIIMLNTDLHSDQIKNKMSKDEFCRNNRGIDNGSDMPRDYMESIYDRILNNEIKMKSQNPNPKKASSGPVDHRKARFYNFMKESQKMVKETRTLIKKGSVMSASAGGDAASAASSSDKSDALNPVDASYVRRKRSATASPFYIASPEDFEAVRPMFEIVWYPVLGVFSILMEESTDSRLIRLVLDGYHAAVRIAALFEMDDPRVAFIRSLRQCTVLGSAKEMQMKNIDAIRMLLDIAFAEGDHLGDSWGEILVAVSEFERLHTLASGTRPKMDIFQLSGDRAMSQFDLQQQQQREQRDSLNSQTLMDQVEASLIDRIFTNSSSLSSEAIVDFVNHLRLVSEQELGFIPNSDRVKPNADIPRVFSLQKMVEITYYNMNRIRIVWSKIWSILSQYFTKTGCHPNLNVSMFVIDSLRQLAMKFLEKDELSNYHYQKQFLKPFEYIMANTKSTEVRELIIQCVSRMILSRWANIKSGWKSVFVVLAIGAADPHEALVSNTFDIMERIMKQHFVHVTETLDDCVNCLVTFGGNIFTDVSLQAIEFIGRCAQYLGTEATTEHLHRQRSSSVTALSGKRPQPVRATSASSIVSDSSESKGHDEAPLAKVIVAGTEVVVPQSSDFEEEQQIQNPSDSAWFVMLSGLAKMIGDRRLEVRSRALQMAFKILYTYGGRFNAQSWAVIFRQVLFPIFDEVIGKDRGTGTPARAPTTLDRSASRGAGALTSSDKAANAILAESWLQTTCLAALSTLVELFSHFHKTVGFLLPEILQLVNTCIDQPGEDLSRIGIKCWLRLLHVAGDQFTSDQWKTVFVALLRVMRTTLPHELQSPAVRHMMGLKSYHEQTPVEQLSKYAKCVADVLEEPYQPQDVDDKLNLTREAAASISKGGVKPPIPSGPAPPAAPAAGDEPAARSKEVTKPEDSREAHMEAPQPEEDGDERTADSADGKKGPRPPSGPPPPPVSVASQSSPARPSAEVATPAGQMASPAPPRGRQSSRSQLPFSSQAVITKCKGQLTLMDSLFEVFVQFGDSMADSHIDLCFKALLSSVQFACAFNVDRPLRRRLWESGFMREKQETPPELFFQEAHGLKLYVVLLARVFNRYSTALEETAEASDAVEDEKDIDREPLLQLAKRKRLFNQESLERAENRLTQLCQVVVEDYVEKVRLQEPEEHRSLRCKSAVVCAVVNAYLEFSDEQFRKHLPKVFYPFTQLIETGSPDIRFCLGRMMAAKLPALLPVQLPPAPPSLAADKAQGGSAGPPQPNNELGKRGAEVRSLQLDAAAAAAAAGGDADVRMRLSQSWGTSPSNKQQSRAPK